MSDFAPRSIEQYLKQLEEALAGEDPAVLQDALYDAEEYLRAELATHPDKSETDVLEYIASSYGAPGEVAEAYRKTEAAVQSALATPQAPVSESAIGRFFGVLRDPRAYSALFYMLLSLATGIVYFTVVVTGASMSLGLAVLIIGVPFFLLFVGTARVLSLVEGRIVETFLGIRMPRRPVYAEKDLPFLEKVMNMLKDVRTWTTMLYMVLMLPLGVAYFTIAVTSVTLTLSLAAGSVLVLLDRAGLVEFDTDVHIFYPGFDAYWATPFIFVVGILLFVVAMHMFKGIGKIHAHVAKSLLVKSAPRTDEA